ncbi:HlyD family efflux transporter periplasmic adaptor subunit [Massilia atriviolacea]|uniref:HlyD family efflux transporter periplasmic adaptor subunit n=1 Tax=Massilia atriviolacea TaxID=2495579 RepID=A0A430HFV0_9BURK|nr:HlyD family efflux transporter periplasmic adaptor subunit [Massilia atriviolacea]RSZ56372.1 HlyD family efflux transporter periplasmic adaptor subunit [Massilia atriviolacea]
MIPRRHIVTAATAAALAAALAWALAPRPVAVETAAAASGRFESAIEEDGKTRLVDQYLVSAPLAGELARIALREGDQVAAGAVVAQLRPARAPLLDERTRRQQQARLAAAEAQVGAAGAALERAGIVLRQAQRDVLRTEQLGRAGFVAASRLDSERLAAQAAQQERDSAAAQRRIALHEAEQARAALDAGAGRDGGAVHPVRAPVGGRVLRVIQASEAVVALGAPLLELGDPDRLEVVADLLTADAVLARPGTPVRIDRWGGPPLDGRVRRVEPAAFTKVSALGVEEQRVRVLIDLAGAGARGAGLGVAYRVNVRIVTTSLENVRKVPVSAVFPLPGKSGADNAGMGAYLVRDGRAHLTPLRLGGRNEAEAWVRDGLAEGAQVIVYPPAQLRDGARVQVREVARPR